MHLQSIGKSFKAKDIVEYLSGDEVKSCLGLMKPISEWTARRWLKTMGYQYGKDKKGMYTDGHERDDVVKWALEVLQGVARREEDGSVWLNYVRLRAVATRAN